MSFMDKVNVMSLEELECFLVNVQMDIMDVILQEKISEGKIVFSEVENGLLN